MFKDLVSCTPRLVGYGVAFLVLAMPVLGQATERWPSDGSDCVRWAAQKRMFFVREVKAFGMNCDIEIVVKKTADKPERIFKVLVPHKKFQSGEPERDAVVSELLGADAHPNVVFQSEPLDEASWAAFESKTLRRVSGQLLIRNIAYPVVLELTFQGQYVLGEMKSSMSHFEVTVPKVGGGAVAKVRDRLGLAFKVKVASLTK